MPLAGGASDKIGNRYEDRWTVYCLVNLLRDEFQTIRLEPPGEDKSEFVLKYRDVEEHHQAKRQLTEGNWTFSKLRSEGLLREFGICVTNPHIHWVFVSGHPAPELRELSERARWSLNWSDFDAKFLDSTKRQYLKELAQEWNGTSDQNAYDALKRIQVITIDEGMLRELNKLAIQQLFDESDSENVVSILKEYSHDNVHSLVSADELWRFLQQRGYTPKSTKEESQATVAPVHPSTTIIERSLTRDIQMLAEIVANETETRLEEIDQARKEEINSDFLTELKNLRANSYRWDSLNSDQKTKALCIEASLELDINHDHLTSLKLVEEARKFALAPRIIRMEALIVAYWHHDLERGKELLVEQVDVNSQNLLAAITFEKGEIEEATHILDRISEPDAETYRLRALINIKGKNLERARANISQAALHAPNWRNIRFLKAVVDFLSAVCAKPLDVASSWPWPPIIHPSFVRLDHEGLNLTRNACSVFKQLIESEKQPGISPPHLWYLACVASDPEQLKDVQAYCEQLLQLDPLHMPTIMWASLIDIKTILTKIRLTLEIADSNKRTTPEHRLILADIYDANNDARGFLQYTHNLKSEFATGQFHISWLHHYVRALLANDEYEQAEAIILESDLTQTVLFGLRTIKLSDNARKTQDWDPLLAHLKAGYQSSRDLFDLLSYSQFLREAEAWDQLAELSDELVQSIDSASVNWLAIQGTFEAGNFEKCLHLVTNYQERFFPIVPAGHLMSIRIHCLEELGRLTEAIDLAKALADQEASEGNLTNLAHLYLLTGDIVSLELLARDLLAKEFRSSPVLLDLSNILQKRNRELAIRLWHAATDNLPDDFVGTSYLLGLQLGLEHEMNVVATRFFSLAEQKKGGAWRASPAEFLNWNRESHRVSLDYETEYFKGTIPFHLYCDARNIPMAVEYYYNFRLWRSQPPLFRSRAIFTRHGSRAAIQLLAPSLLGIKLHADITSILLASSIDALEIIELSFTPLYIPQDLIPSLTIMENSLAREQEDFLRAKRQVAALVGDGINTVDLSDAQISLEASELKDELRASQIRLFELAKNTDGYYVGFLPLHKFTKSAEYRLSEIPEHWLKFAITCRAIAFSLLQLGKIGSQQYNNALTKFPEDSSELSTVTLPRHTKLYFDDNILESLAQAEILTTACETFDVITSDDYIQLLQTELQWRRHSDEVAQWINRLIQHLSEGIRMGKYQPLPNPKRAKLFDFGINMRCMHALLEVTPASQKMIWIDDRFSNSVAFGETPTVGINDILKSLLVANKISKSQYYDYLVKLRTANARYIPVEAEEMLFYLQQAPLHEDELLETLELRILRRYIAAVMEQPCDLQYPIDLPEELPNQRGEIDYVGHLKLNIYKLFPLIWTQIDSKAHRRAAADWILGCVFFDYMALIESYYDQLGDFRTRRVVPDLVALTTQLRQIIFDNERPDDRYKTLVPDFIDWLWTRILEPQILTNPGLLGAIAERIKVIFDSFRESARTITDDVEAENAFLRLLYVNLPAKIKQQLDDDPAFLESIDVQVRAIIQLEDLRFDAQVFWQAVSDALKGVPVATSPRNSTAEYKLTVRVEADNTNIILSNPSAPDELGFSVAVVYPGIASSSIDEQKSALQGLRYSLDCSNEEFITLQNEVIENLSPYERMNVVDQYLGSSATVYYAKLFSFLQQVKPGDMIDMPDLLPPSFESLRRHVRLPKESQDFRAALSKASKTLLKENDLPTTIQRIAAFPIPLSPALSEQFLQADKHNQEIVVRHLMDYQSPVSLIHILALYVASHNQDEMSNLLRYTLQNDYSEHVMAFLRILNWFYISSEALPDSSDFSDSVKLGLIWMHTHYLFALWLKIRAPLTSISHLFSLPLSSFSNPFDSIHGECYLDIANPMRIDRLHITLSSLAYALQSTNGLSLSSELQAALRDHVVSSEGDSFAIPRAALRDGSRASNFLGSFLGLNVADIINGLLFEAILPAQMQQEELVREALIGLHEDPRQRIFWHRLIQVLGDLPVYEDLKDDLLSVLLDVDYLELYRHNVDLGCDAMLVSCFQIPYLDSPDLLDKLEVQIIGITSHLASIENQLREEYPEDELKTLISYALLTPIFRIIRLQQSKHEKFIRLLDQIIDIWPYTVPFMRPVVENIQYRLEANDRVSYWPLLMKLRARDQ